MDLRKENKHSYTIEIQSTDLNKKKYENTRFYFIQQKNKIKTL